VLETVCPAVFARPTCRFLVNSAPQMKEELCQVVAFNATWTRRVCSLSSTVTQRRLQAVDGEDVVDYMQSFTVVMMLEEVMETFVDTIRTAEQTDLSTFQRAKIVVYMFLALAVCVALCATDQLRPSCAPTVRNPNKPNHRRTTNRLSTTVAVADTAVAGSIQDSKMYLAKYIESLLPAVFLAESGFKALWMEIQKHHKYITLITGSSSKHRTRTALHLYSNAIFLIFMLALAFDLEVRVPHLWFTTFMSCLTYCVIIIFALFFAV
jgi:hypothetical protein